MGIIIKQSIKGSIWSYLGVAIGFVTTSYLYPNYLTPDIIGLFSLLLAWSALFALFSSLGFNGVTARLFPYFRNKEKGHNGYLFIAFFVMIVGYILFLIVYFNLSPQLIKNNAEKSQLFSEYIYLLLPLVFFTLFFNILDSFNKLLYNTVLGTFLKEFLQRFFVFVIILLFVFKWLTIHQMILAYATVVCLKGVIIFVYLLVKGELSLKPQLQFVDTRMRKEMINVAAYSVLKGVGSNIIFTLDKIIVNYLLGISATGIYTIAFFFGTLVVIPSRPLLRISGTLIADAWKRNDVKYIADIYKKSCLNQFIIAIFLFGGIWVNIDSILVILGPEYASGKWVILLIALGYLIDMATGTNGLIIGFSKYYRTTLWFMLIQVAVALSAMYLLIPAWGITGAAASITISFLLINTIRFIYLYNKFQMQPFSVKFITVVAVFALAFGAGYIIPELPLIMDVMVRGTLFTIVFVLLTVQFHISVDINVTVSRIIGQLKTVFKTK